jgi:hypothetical protein
MNVDSIQGFRGGGGIYSNVKPQDPGVLTLLRLLLPLNDQV